MVNLCSSFNMASARTDGFVDNWQAGKSLADCNRHMLTSEDSCDVTFRVGKMKKTVRAHRYVLISRSCVFHAMLCGPLAEKDEIKMPDVEETTFRELMLYLYTENCHLTPDNVTGVIYLAKKYAVSGLESLCLTYLESSLSADNACVILEQAHRFDEKGLYDRTLTLILEHVSVCVSSSAFTELCKECFDRIIESVSRDVPPEKVFQAAVSWAEAECERQGREATPDAKRESIGKSLFAIGFAEMDQKVLVKKILPAGILKMEEGLKILSYFVCTDEDISPFKRRSEGRCSSFKIEIYEGIKRSSLKRYEWYQRLNLHCSRDIILSGIQVYATQASEYRVSVNNNTDPEEMSTEDCHFTTVDDGTSTVMLSTPVQLRAQTDYSVFIQRVKGRPPSFFGVDLKSVVSVGQCTIMLSHIDGPNLICALCLNEIVR